MAKAFKQYHKSSPTIPTGLIPRKEWAASVGLTDVCAAQWVSRGKLKGYRVPGYGVKCFVQKTEADKLMRPSANIPAIAR